MDTIKIDLGKGASAYVYSEVLNRTYEAHEALLRECMTPVGDTIVKMSEMEGKKLPRIEYLLDVSKIDDNRVRRIYILNQVSEWSLGPVNEETIDKFLTRDQMFALVREMDRLYKSIPLPGKKESVIDSVRRLIRPSS